MTEKSCIVILALSLLTVSCTKEKKTENGPVHSVMLVSPEGLGEVSEKEFSGVVEEGREINVAFKTGGQISAIAVKEGQYVKQGQLIATLDDKDYRLGVESAKAQYEQNQKELARLKQLYERKSITGNDYDKAVAGAKQLRVNLQSYQNQLSYTKLYAPTSGYVKSVNYQRSEMVDAGMPVVNLLDVKRMEVTTNVPASVYLERGRIKNITCKGAFTNGEDLPLQLISIVPKADNNQLYKMRLALPSDKAKIASGMNVDITLHFAEGESAGNMTVPLHSVFKKDGKTYVWIYNASDSTVSKKEIETGGVDGEGKAVVKSGLSGGEKIVKAGVNVLSDKEKVRVIEKASETNAGGII